MNSIYLNLSLFYYLIVIKILLFFLNLSLCLLSFQVIYQFVKIDKFKYLRDLIIFFVILLYFFIYYFTLLFNNHLRFFFILNDFSFRFFLFFIKIKFFFLSVILEFIMLIIEFFYKRSFFLSLIIHLYLGSINIVVLNYITLLICF